MSYHDLSECTLTDYERIVEANKIIGMLEGCELNNNAMSMIEQVTDTQKCSIKQLFWLRDLKDKSL